MQESSRASLTHPHFEENAERQKETRQQMILERQKAAAKMLLNADYPERVKIEMQTAFSEGKYEAVQRLAAEYDIKEREVLDAKITMYPNPNFKEEPDIERINSEIKEKFLDILTKSSLERLLEQGEEVLLKQEELEAMKPHETEDPNPRFLFRAEGIDSDFDSAYKAIRAYKEKNGIRQPNPGKHSFRKTLVYVDNVEGRNEDLCCRSDGKE